MGGWYIYLGGFFVSNSNCIRGRERERGEMEGAGLAMKPVIKVAALCGSLRRASFNGGLIRSGKPPSPFLSKVVDPASLSLLLLFCSHPAVRRVHRGDEDRVRRHRSPPLPKHRPRGRRQVPRARGGLPAEDPRSWRLPFCFPRV